MQLSKEFLDGLATEIPKMVEAFSNPTTEQTESRKKWNYDHAFDFLYGETIGWIEGYIIRSFIAGVLSPDENRESFRTFLKE